MADWKNSHHEMEGLEEEEMESVEEQRSFRYGGAQADEDDDARAKREERDRKKAEVRKRLEEAGRAKKAKKGFLTPERKKKLRKLLMLKAAEDLKQQQLLKEQERQKILKERIVALPDVDSINNQNELEKILQAMHKRIIEIETGKYDINVGVRDKDHEINELTIAVNDLRGKFVKPTLKKISKYDNKFKKMAEQKKEITTDFRGNLKKGAKTDIDKLLAISKDQEAPDWKKKQVDQARGEASEAKGRPETASEAEQTVAATLAIAPAAAAAE